MQIRDRQRAGTLQLGEMRAIALQSGAAHAGRDKNQNLWRHVFGTVGYNPAEIR